MTYGSTVYVIMYICMFVCMFRVAKINIESERYRERLLLGGRVSKLSVDMVTWTVVGYGYSISNTYIGWDTSDHCLTVCECWLTN